MEYEASFLARVQNLLPLGPITPNSIRKLIIKCNIECVLYGADSGRGHLRRMCRFMGREIMKPCTFRGPFME